MTSRALESLNRRTLIIQAKAEHPDWIDERVAQEVGCHRSFASKVLRDFRETNSRRTLPCGPVAKPAPLSPLDELDRLTAAGWGDVPQKKIPVHVWAAVRAGRSVPPRAGEDWAAVLGGKR